jgi:hypothetical protein
MVGNVDKLARNGFPINLKATYAIQLWSGKEREL